MPAFKDSMTDDQLAELVSYLRQQFAPDKPPWTGVRRGRRPGQTAEFALTCHARPKGYWLRGSPAG